VEDGRRLSPRHAEAREKVVVDEPTASRIVRASKRLRFSAVSTSGERRRPYVQRLFRSGRRGSRPRSSGRRAGGALRRRPSSRRRSRCRPRRTRPARPVRSPRGSRGGRITSACRRRRSGRGSPFRARRTKFEPMKPAPPVTRKESMGAGVYRIRNLRVPFPFDCRGAMGIAARNGAHRPVVSLPRAHALVSARHSPRQSPLHPYTRREGRAC
jgi:hypothetical protein